MSSGSTVTLSTDDGPMPTYESRPEGKPRGGAVVVQEAFGLTSHIEGVTRWLADAGYHAVAPALFHRQGAPVLSYDDFDRVRPAMEGLTAGGITTDLHAALAHLNEAGHAEASIGVIGFCMGGTVSFVAGTLHPLGAAVTFYGSGIRQGRFGFPSLLELAPKLASPWLGLYGDRDQGISVEEVEELRGAVAGATVDTEIVRYPDAEHGFNCDDRPSFNAAASADARLRTLQWFDRHLSART